MGNESGKLHNTNLEIQNKIKKHGGSDWVYEIWYLVVGILIFFLL